MRLYGAIQKIEPQDDGTVRVYGIATSEAVDEQGEIVRADAIRTAIPDYMRFPALREMHQLSAAGSTLEAEVCEDGTTRIVAHVVDPVAVAKVRNQVYRGFSIGGRVTQREAGNPKTITGLVLNEISLVDRPANPEAIFDCWKAAMPPDAPPRVAEPVVAQGGSTDTEQAPSGPQPFNVPIQIWACTVPNHRHMAKVDALKCLEGSARLAADGRATAAARARMTNNERDQASRASLRKALRDVGQIARVIAELEWLRGALELEAAIENDQAPQPARRQAIITELCDFLSCLANEEIGEIPGDAETDGSPLGSAMPEMLGIADVSDVERVAALRSKGRSNMPQLAGGAIAKSKHSRGDQALLSTAHFACDQCLKFGGLTVDEQANMERARDYLQKAGAVPAPPGTAGRMEDDDPSPAWLECPAGDNPEFDIVNVLAAVTKVLCKRELAHQNLMDLAHECLQVLTDGRVCEKATKLGARHSKETMELFKASHGHLIAAGARCDATGVDGPRPPAQLASETDMRAADLANALPEEPAEKAALAKILREVVPMIERLTKRVDEIARTPLPPLTMAKGTISVSKQQDRGSNVGSSDPELSPEVIAAALAKMSKEEQTLTLIKASYATPIRIAGSAADQPLKSTVDQPLGATRSRR
jgi:hypothetical protein